MIWVILLPPENNPPHKMNNNSLLCRRINKHEVCVICRSLCYLSKLLKSKADNLNRGLDKYMLLLSYLDCM
jgi:hypothetical protein